MSTAKGAAEALRRIHIEEMIKPKDADVERCVALDELSKTLVAYAESLPQHLDDTYNFKCRQRNIYPIPLEHTVLSPEAARALYWRGKDNAKTIQGLNGFKSLEAIAREARVQLTLCLRPYGATVICNFVPVTEGEAHIVIL